MEAPRRPLSDTHGRLRLFRHGIPLAAVQGGGRDDLEGPPALTSSRVVPVVERGAEDLQRRGAHANPDGDPA